MITQVLNFLNINSPAITAISVIVVALFWVFKLSYEKNRKEAISLGKLERILILNQRYLKDNIDFMGQWIENLKLDRPYSCHFESMRTDEESNFSLSSLKLINEVFKMNYKLKRCDDDLKNFYKNYWEIILKIDNISDNQRKEENLKEYHKNIISTLEFIKLNSETIYKEIIPVLAHIQVMGRVKFHSLFGYFNLLHTNIFPRPTYNKIQERTKDIEKQLFD